MVGALNPCPQLPRRVTPGVSLNAAANRAVVSDPARW